MSIITNAAVFALVFSGCTESGPELGLKDWDNTSDYFASSDEKITGFYYKPYAGYVGDPMPFYDQAEGNFKILYLQNYDSNPVATYHPIWGLSTDDASSYVSLGELIPCGSEDEQDAALGTGSTVYNEADGLYYTFYTGNKYRPTSSESGQAVMLATSPDFRTWTKDRTLYIKGEDNGYSKSDFRDPEVFEGEDGRWHMLVSTTLDGKGVLAEYASDDLKDWEHVGVFMTMMWDRFYECPDLFRMGDWWYLVYSEMHSSIRKVQYFKGRTLDELKACTSGDAGIWPDSREGFLDSRAFYAGKTASDGENRYIWGWCPTRPGNDNTDTGAAPSEPSWSGSLVAHKIVQHEDGTLTLECPDGISAKFVSEQTVKVMETDEETIAAGENAAGKEYVLNGNKHILFNRLGIHNRITFTVTTDSSADRFGFSLVRGSNSAEYYSVIFNPEDDGANRKLNFEEEGPDGIGFIDGIDSYKFSAPSDNTYHVTIVTDNSVCTVYVNGDATWTNRIYGIQKNCWSINSYGGNITVSDILVSSY